MILGQIHLAAANTWFTTLLLCGFFSLLTSGVLKRLFPSLSALERWGVSPFLWGAPILTVWNILPTSFGLLLPGLFFLSSLSIAVLVRKDLWNSLKLLRKEQLIPIFLPILIFGSIHYLAGSLGPVATSNNDAFFYVPSAEFLSNHTLREIPPLSPERPSFHVLNSFGIQGVSRAGFSAMAGYLLGILKLLHLPSSAIHVVPALNFFFVSVGSIFCFHFLGLTGLPILASSILTSAMLLSVHLQRLYWENFYPATAGAVVLLCAFFCRWLEAEAGKRRAWFASTLWQWTLWTLYPEALAFYLSFELAHVLAETIRKRSLLPGVGLLLASLAAAALTPIAVYRYTHLLPMVLELKRTPQIIPFSFFQNYTLGLGVAPSFFETQAFPSVSLLLTLVTLAGFGAFVTNRRHRKLFPLLAFSSLAIVLSANNAVQRGELYSLRRIFELNLYLVPLLGSFSLSFFFRKRALTSVGYALTGFLLIVGGSGHVSAQDLLRGFIRSYQLYPTAQDLNAVKQVNQNKKVALIGAASMERSLFLSHFYLSFLDQQQRLPSPYAQAHLSYFHEGTLNPKFSPIADFISAEAGLFVSKTECMNALPPRPIYVDPIPPLFVVPLSEQIRFSALSPTDCLTTFYPQDAMLLVRPKLAEMSGPPAYEGRFSAIGNFEITSYELGGQNPERLRVSGTPLTPIEIHPPGKAGQALLVTALTEGQITKTSAKSDRGK